jgi:hypothetical protein
MTIVDGRHCPAIVGLLSGFLRTNVRNQSDSMSAFVEMRDKSKPKTGF